MPSARYSTSIGSATGKRQDRQRANTAGRPQPPRGAGRHDRQSHGRRDRPEAASGLGATLAGHHWRPVGRNGRRRLAPRQVSPVLANATELHRDLPRVGVAMLRLLGQAPLDEFAAASPELAGLSVPIGGGSSRMIALSVSTDVSLANGRWRSAARTESPRTRTDPMRKRRPCPQPVRETCSRPCRESRHRRQTAPGERIDAQSRASGSDGRFASPKSSTFTVPSRRA